VSLEVGGGILCRTNPVAALLAVANRQTWKQTLL